MHLPDFTQSATPRPFIDALRPICEFIFDLMLQAYVSSLWAWHNRSQHRSTPDGKPRKSLDKWELALACAQQALEGFRDAETKRRTQLIAEANTIAGQAMESLKHRYVL